MLASSMRHLAIDRRIQPNCPMLLQAVSATDLTMCLLLALTHGYAMSRYISQAQCE